MYRKIILALSIAALLSGYCRGQERPDFSGTWKLNLDKSDYGDLQGPSSRTDIIRQNNGEITESVTALQKHKPLDYTLRFSTGGLKTVFPPGAGIHIPPVTLQSISATWQDSALVVVEGLMLEGSNLTARYFYTLSPDGKTLTMTLLLDGRTPAATFVFDKVTTKRPISKSRYAPRQGCPKPQQLGPDHVCEYQVHLFRDRKLSPRNIEGRAAALRFLFVKTLHQPYLPDAIPFPKQHKCLPTVLSQGPMGTRSRLHLLGMAINVPATRRVRYHRHVGLEERSAISTPDPTSKRYSGNAQRV
jgi:hypothetical protein